MAYPSVISTLATPLATDRLNSPSHSTLHQNENSAILEIEAAIGTDSSIIGTIIGDLRNPLSNGGGHVQTANKGGTGQTSFNKGDLLVAQSSSVLSKLAVGGDGQVLTADSAQAVGVKWGAGASPAVRVYSTSSVTSSGSSSLIATWFKPSTLSYAIIETLGPGGGGGGTTSASNGTPGGGAGGYGRKYISAASLPLAASVIAGLGGAGGAATGGAGGNGGTSRFGSILTATGGLGGDANFTGGAGGSVLGADVNVSGGRAANISATGTPRAGTNGADSPYGAGGFAGIQSGAGAIPGSTAIGYGSGGGGAFTGTNGDDSAGGPGADGLIIITEY